MPRYTITIAAEDGSAETVVEVLEEDGTSRITELTMRAPDGGINGRLPVDLDLLVRAVVGAGVADLPRTVRSAPAGPGPDAAAVPGGGPDGPEEPGSRPGPAQPGPAQPGPAHTGPAQPGLAARVYRKAPDDLIAVYERIGSVGGVAEHFGVPRHTAQGWIGRLRRAAGTDT